MDPWFFALLLVFGFGGVLVARRSTAPYLFTLFGGLCLLFAGLGMFVDGGLSLPQPLTNSTLTTDYAYNASVNYTVAHYECVNASYYPTNAYVWANGSAYCDPADTLITTYCEEKPVTQTIETRIESVSYTLLNDYWTQALALILTLLGLAFMLSMIGEAKLHQ